MIYMLMLLTFVSLSFSKVIVESNYPLRNNNFQKIASEENLPLILWALQSLKDVRNIKIMSVGGDTVIYVERYPILKRIEVEGNWFADEEKIKNLILAREKEPLVDFDPEVARETLMTFYRNNGFLDAKVSIDLKVDEKGYAYIRVKVREGDIYFLGGAVFDGAESFDRLKLLAESGLRLGEVYSEEKAKKGRFLLQDFYRKMGFLESFVYYEGTQKRTVKSPFAYVLFPGAENARRRFLDGTSSILGGISNLLSHPLGTLKALVGKGSLAFPVYSINEGRRYRIVFKGSRSIGRDELLALIDLNTPGVDISFFEGTREKIEEYYRSKGFFDVKVSYSFEMGSVVYRIDEGSRYRLIPLGFKGLKLPEFYDREVIEKAKESFLEEVRSRGYGLASIRTLEEIDREGKRVFLVVVYSPGKRLILKEVKLAGKDRELEGIFDKFNALLPTFLDDRILDELHKEIGRWLTERGYLDGDFSVDVRVSEDENNMYFSYVYTIEKGERYRYGELLIYGNDVTRDREIYYTVVKQRYYSSEAEEESLWNLIQSESFTGVHMENSVDRDRKVVHRLVEVREDKRGLLELSVGYNTEEKLKLEGGIKLKNLLGVGIIGELRASRSQRYETYEVGISDRFLFSRRYFADVSLFRKLEFHESFDLQSTGYALSVGYRPKRWISISVFASNTLNEVTGTGEGRYRLLRYGLFAVRERMDDIVNPSNITHNSVRLSRAVGDSEYYRIEMNNFILREVVKGVSVSGKLALGWVGEGAPIFDRFFLGGLRDMRGYDFESIGYPDGGRTYTFGRAELLFSLRAPLWASLYTEAGNVGGSFPETIGDLKYDVGGAVGLRTPAGSIRLDVAKPLSKLPKPVSKFKIYLSIGFVY